MKKKSSIKISQPFNARFGSRCLQEKDPAETYKNRIKSERWDRADSKIATPTVL